MAENSEGGNKKIIVIAVCCSILGGLIATGCSTLVNEKKQEEKAVTEITTVYQGKQREVVVTEADTSRLLTASQVYEANVNSTVGITTSITTNYFGYITTTPASGSGFIISEDGYIVTNYHVIEDAESITVTLYDGTSYEAKTVGYDESNDIAVLKVDAKDLVPVVLGNSGDLRVGEEVLAIGNPLGELTFSLTSGTVSALDREVTLYDSSMNLIQTDCAINSGNSGGALFNMYGEVIGITNAKYSSNGLTASIDNIAFAIPIDSVKTVIKSLIENGYVSKPYIGVMVSDLEGDYKAFGLPSGAVIRSVTEDSPAEAAGLQENDIITHVNGTEITGYSGLKKYINASTSGDVLALTVYRKGETVTLNVTVGEYIEQTDNTNEKMPQHSDHVR
ncbi:MAG: trypsin-like peptidase domain-containing protein [Sphaerochaetaceae bacterium]|nr:trypsin-like peptidase domain-containing protein [Sphaerochaetaceae bacterium]